jgi:hypothetical protein
MIILKEPSFTLKRPSTATSLAEANSLASSTVAIALAAGPVFLSNQLTISSAVRPPNMEIVHLLNTVKDQI